MLRLYNTLSGQVEDFHPLEANKVKMYVCGPTVYGLLHIGNGRTFMFWDVARRYLVHRGFDVSYVQNFTDIDDKIIQRAAEENVSAQELSENYMRAYFEDMDGLGLERATQYPRATQWVEGMIAHIQGLIDKDLAYAVDGDVYFRVRRFEGYGKLSGRKLDDNQEGARVEVDPRKEDPMDFAMWKAAKPGEPAWESPWGPGRPGWHIECSAMVRGILGDTIDIHAGGMDLKFPHHENEIAQSEGLTEHPFVRFWMHTGFLNMDAEKMSKSLGNIKTTREMLAVYGQQALRVFLLSTHYRSELSFSDEAIRGAELGWKRLRENLAKIESASAASTVGGPAANAHITTEELLDGFNGAMDDDLNTASAIAHFYRYASDMAAQQSKARKDGTAMPDFRPHVARLRDLSAIIGLDLTAPEKKDAPELNDRLSGGLLTLLIEIRREAKGQKNWALADTVRNGLKELGIQLVDQKDGSTQWESVPEVTV